MNTYKAAVFDMDGTVLDTLCDLTNSVNYALYEHGYPLRTRDEVRGFVGNGIRKLIERAVPQGTDKAVTDGVYSTFTLHYADHCADMTKPYDGVIELLQKLKKAGYLTAVVTNKADYAAQALAKEMFCGLFDVAVGEREGIRIKPAPDEVNIALHALGVERKNAVYIGDSDVDIETAKNSGLPCISVTWGFRSREFLIAHGATALADTPDELCGLLF